MKVSRISCALAEKDLPSLDHRNWVDAPGVQVRFDIHHRGSSILLKYLVEEPQVRAIHKGHNSAVWEDSCVEFFLALEEDPNYYNFEFSAIGTVLGAYGPDRHQREWIPGELLDLVQCHPSLGPGIILNLEGPVRWSLEVVLPLKVLHHHDLHDIAGTRARGNFYKTGDKLEHPHYLSWMPVGTEQPDFHQPRFFGELVFD
jgi:hypothetical protein